MTHFETCRRDFRSLLRSEDYFAKARGLETGPGRIKETTAEKRKTTATIMPKATDKHRKVIRKL